MPAVLLPVLHLWPHVLNDPHELMAQDLAILHTRHTPFVGMQVSATDAGGGDLQDDILLQTMDGWPQQVVMTHMYC